MLSTFPKFTPLELDDKAVYDKMVADYPPFSDISFATLHIWWNLEGNLTVAVLNGNLVVRYYQPFDTQNSGYSLVGRHDVDKSLEILFDYLQARDEPLKLVHVPEFVTKEISHVTRFKLAEELDYNEYILDTKELTLLAGFSHKTTRWEINHFLHKVEDRQVEIKPLDLTSDETKQDLLSAMMAWENASPRPSNDPEHTERRAIERSITHASILGMQHLGLYIDGTLHAIVLYHQSHDKNYYIVNHLKVNYSIPYIFDYMTHKLAGKAAEENVAYLNYEMDLGIENLRSHKMRLRPVDFLRKYTITPVEH